MYDLSRYSIFTMAEPVGDKFIAFFSLVFIFCLDNETLSNTNVGFWRESF